jgi:hypothetical protein
MASLDNYTGKTKWLNRDRRRAKKVKPKMIGGKLNPNVVQIQTERNTKIARLVMCQNCLNKVIPTKKHRCPLCKEKIVK